MFKIFYLTLEKLWDDPKVMMKKLWDDPITLENIVAWPWKILCNDPMTQKKENCRMNLWLWRKLWDCMLDPCDPTKLQCDDSRWICLSLGNLNCNAIWNFYWQCKINIFLYLNAFATWINSWCIFLLTLDDLMTFGKNHGMTL